MRDLEWEIAEALAMEVKEQNERGKVKMTAADWAIGKWLSAALDDPTACKEIKADIHEWFKEKDMSSPPIKDVPEYDENIVCENPECKHLEAPAITGLYGIAGGGGAGVYSVCEHCGTVLSKTIDPDAVCHTQTVELKDAETDSEPKPDLDK
jgi:hypothetical protein